MADNEILIRVKAVTQQAETALKGFASTIKALAATALVSLAAKALQVAADLTELGQAAQLAHARVSLLLGSSQAADTWGRAIQDATGGAIDSLQAMTLADQLFSFGLAKTADEAGVLAKQLFILTGGSEEVIRNFALMFSNDAIRRVDTFGLSANAVTQRMEELAAAQSDLTYHERFEIAVKEQLAERTEALSGVMDESATKTAQLEGAIRDLKLQAAEAAAEGFSPLIDGVYAFNEAIGEATGGDQIENLFIALDKLRGAALQGAIVTMFTRAVAEGKSLAEALDLVKEFTESILLDAGAISTEESRAADAAAELARQQAAAADETDRLAKSVSKIGDEVSKPKFANLGGLFDDLGSIFDKAKAKIQGLTGGTEQIAAESGLTEERIKQAFIAEMIHIGADDATVLKVKKAFGMLTPDEEAVLTELNRLATLAATGQLSDAELSQLSGAFAAGNFGALGGIAAGRTSRGVSPAVVGGSPELAGGGVGASVGGGGAGVPAIQVNVTTDELMDKRRLKELIEDTVAQGIVQVTSGAARVGPSGGGSGRASVAA